MSKFNDTNLLKLGLIGAGPWGRNYIATIAKINGIFLARLASSNPDSVKLVDPDCVISEKWEHVIDDENLDGLVIASPAATHTEIALAAINKGLAVLIEKPMTLSVADAEKILTSAKRKEAIVMVDHIHLYSAAWEVLQREVAELGVIRSMKGNAGKWGPLNPKTSVLWEWGSHDVAMCISLMKQVPEKVSVKRIESRIGGETLNLSLDFGDVDVSLTISNLYEKRKRSFSVYFDNGKLIYDDILKSKDKLRFKTSQNDLDRTFRLNTIAPLERCVLSFRDLIIRGLPEWSDATLGLQVVKTLARIESSL